MDLTTLDEMVLVGSAQHCTTIAPKESPAEAGLLYSEHSVDAELKLPDNRTLLYLGWRIQDRGQFA